MDTISLGRTNLKVTRSAFGALPIQRVDMEGSIKLLRKAFDSGINFYDTARMYTDSEEKLGRALSGVRHEIILATKSMGQTKAVVLKELEESLKQLKTDYIDLYQLHNPKELPDPEDENSSYAALTEAKAKGLVRFIGVTNHKVDTAMAAVRSGLYDTVQFPFSCLSSETDIQLVQLCSQYDIGFIAMKAMSGGLITDARATFAFIRQFDNVVPIWGIQKESELEEFISLEKNPPQLDEALKTQIEGIRSQLTGNFCRGCGYCGPCPEGIPIHVAARMTQVIGRFPSGAMFDEENRKNMELITQCKECGLCKQRCPYELDIPVLLKRMLAEYRELYSAYCTGK